MTYSVNQMEIIVLLPNIWKERISYSNTNNGCSDGGLSMPLSIILPNSCDVPRNYADVLVEDV